MIKEKVGKHLKELRMSKGYSQERFALKCRLHRTYIAGVEAGNRNISLENLYKIAQALGVSLAELCDYEKSVQNTILLNINGINFILQTDCELTLDIKEDIETICKMACDEDEPSLEDELKRMNIDCIDDADSYDIAEALSRTIKNEFGIDAKFKAINLEVNIAN